MRPVAMGLGDETSTEPPRELNLFMGPQMRQSGAATGEAGLSQHAGRSFRTRREGRTAVGRYGSDSRSTATGRLISALAWHAEPARRDAVLTRHRPMPAEV